MLTKYIVNTNDLTLTTDVAEEPVTLIEMKTHLRVDHSDEDDLIGNLIQAAREHVENETQTAMVERVYRADLPDFWSALRLPLRPLQEIVRVKY